MSPPCGRRLPAVGLRSQSRAGACRRAIPGEGVAAERVFQLARGPLSNAGRLAAHRIYRRDGAAPDRSYRSGIRDGQFPDRARRDVANRRSTPRWSGLPRPLPRHRCVYRGSGPHIKSEFIVAPGEDPARIRLRYGGADRLRGRRAMARCRSAPDGTRCASRRP